MIIVKSRVLMYAHFLFCNGVNNIQIDYNITSLDIPISLSQIDLPFSVNVVRITL